MTVLTSPKSRRGDWFQTFSGRQFWPLDPRADDVCIADIAHGLSNVARFGGHTLTFYSVAEHSVWVSEHCPKFPLLGLMHDATEAYLGDMVRPLKNFMPDYRIAEARVWSAICERFGLPTTLPPEVKAADNLALITERRDLMRPTWNRWSAELEALTPDPAKIHPLDYDGDLRALCFSRRYYQLVGI